MAIHLSEESGSAPEAADEEASKKADMNFEGLLKNCKSAIERKAIYSEDKANVFTLHYWADKAANQVEAAPRAPAGVGAADAATTPDANPAPAATTTARGSKVDLQTEIIKDGDLAGYQGWRVPHTLSLCEDAAI